MIHSDKNKHSKSAQDKLLFAALELFAKNGFDGTSTREICKKAGVNISLIPYYFGGKEGLFHASVKMLAEFVLEQMNPVLQKIDNVQNNTKKENILLLHSLIERFAEFILNVNLPKTVILLIIREQLEPSPAFEILYNTTMKHVYGAFKKLVAAILNIDESEPEVTYRTTTIAGQMLSFRIVKQATLRSLGKDEYTNEDIRAIKQIIISNTNAILKLDGEF
ncbi:MAG TPA: hypothetical protein DDW90_06845 [Cyanobacteria bacterium UBA9971]|nr:hypothetical protein [Cyanobacteria bacterium UBA9971]